jgi:hypothetical protein
MKQLHVPPTDIRVGDFVGGRRVVKVLPQGLTTTVYYRTPGLAPRAFDHECLTNDCHVLVRRSDRAWFQALVQSRASTVMS